MLIQTPVKPILQKVTGQEAWLKTIYQDLMSPKLVTAEIKFEPTDHGVVCQGEAHLKCTLICDRCGVSYQNNSAFEIEGRWSQNNEDYPLQEKIDLEQLLTDHIFTKLSERHFCNNCQ